MSHIVYLNQEHDPDASEKEITNQASHCHPKEKDYQQGYLLRPSLHQKVRGI